MKRINIILNILMFFIIASYIYAFVIGSPISPFEILGILILIFFALKLKIIKKDKD